MAEETQYTANTGMVTLTAANTSLTAGTIGTDIFSVITGASNGTLIKTVTVKCQGVTTQGMVRLWIYDGSTKLLISEIEIPAVIPSAEDPAFEIKIPVDYALKSGWQLLASTEIYNASAKFNVIAEGLNWAYYASAVRPESSNYTGNTGMQTISTANTNLDGTGTLSSAIVTGASNGTQIQTVSIKSQVSIAVAGMVRLFLYDGTNTKLLTEMLVPAVTKSATAHSFSRTIDLNFALKSGWSLKASTEKGDTFNVIAEGLDWAYPA